MLYNICSVRFLVYAENRVSLQWLNVGNTKDWVRSNFEKQGKTIQGLYGEFSIE